MDRFACSCFSGRKESPSSNWLSAIPGEGGVYLWAKEVFGDFHGFLSGWCYWTNNMLYVPTVMLYFVGVSVFVLGPSHQAWRTTRHSPWLASVGPADRSGGAEHRGAGRGQVGEQPGAIGTLIAAAVLIGLGITIWSRFGTTVTAADFRDSS